jgi:hypothetical protein
MLPLSHGRTARARIDIDSQLLERIGSLGREERFVSGFLERLPADHVLIDVGRRHDVDA